MVIIKKYYYILMALFVSVFLISGGLLLRNLWMGGELDEKVDELKSLRIETPEMDKDEIKSDESNNPSYQGKDIEHDKESAIADAKPKDAADVSGISALHPLKELNPDFAGWLLIPGTEIDYPVMQTIEEPFFYIDKDFDKNNSKYGMLFLAADCKIEDSFDTLLIYGHHMKDGRMFGGLKHYERVEYYKNHSVVYFETLFDKQEYQIFAIFKTTVSAEGFPYYDYINLYNKDDFDAFISMVMELSLYDTDIIPMYGSRLLMLSTCEYSDVDGRLVIVAMKSLESE